MHRRRVMYNDVYSHYPSFSYPHYGINVCSSYEIPESLSISDRNIYVSPYYPYRRKISYIDYPYYGYVSRPVLPPLPIVQTNVEKDVCYYFDDPNIEYDDEYGNVYRLPRSKIQLVDLVPKTKIRTTNNRMLVSTFQPKEPPERIIIPRSTVIRHTSLPLYERPKHVRVVPLYHSADHQYLVSNRRSFAKELIPVATVYNSYYSPRKRTIKVRSLSP